jgi:hypothetical protein
LYKILCMTSDFKLLVQRIADLETENLNSRLTSILTYNTFIILIGSKIDIFYFVISK